MKHGIGWFCVISPSVFVEIIDKKYKNKKLTRIESIIADVYIYITIYPHYV